MAVTKHVAVIRLNGKLLLPFKTKCSNSVQCRLLHISSFEMYPRKNSPFIEQRDNDSFGGSVTVPRRRSIPDNLFQKPEIPEKLMKYNEHKNRIVMDSTGGMLSSYNPILKKSSIFSFEGWRQRWQSFKDTLISTYSIGMIKRSVKPFKVREFAKEAEKLFIDVNECLTKGDMKGLLENTTLNAYYGFVKEFFDAKRKFHWRFISSMERPRIVYAVISSMEIKDNLFAQVVVRLKIKQIFAVEDQNGRVIAGDSEEPRELLDFIVLERHLSDKNGAWRICGKLYPKQ